jgi:hypothetical protein
MLLRVRRLLSCQCLFSVGHSNFQEQVVRVQVDGKTAAWCRSNNPK